MLAFEIMFLIMGSIVAIVTIAAVGRPLAEAYSEKLKQRYKEIGPEQERNLIARISSLEEEIRELKGQVQGIKDTTDFAVKMIESRGEEKLDS
jgi:hypothetical protein